MEILEQYGVGENILRLLRNYWENQEVAARQEQYHGEAFKPTRGVTQGDIVSPTIFNIVVDAIVRYWFSIISEDREDVETLGIRVQEKQVLFYADDGLTASRDPKWLQEAFDVLVGLFERVGLKTNVLKTKSMACTPGYISSQISAYAYKHKMGEGGDSYRERKKRRVVCPECGKNLAAGSLCAHMLKQHGLVGDTEQDLGSNDDDPEMFKVDFSPFVPSVQCPVNGCPGRCVSKNGLRQHFMRRHVQHTIIISQEGAWAHPRCEKCDMFVSQFALGQGHQNTAMCRDGAARKRQRLAVETARRATSVAFTAYGDEIESVKVFKYLGRQLSSTDCDWPALYKNLSKARKRWGMVSRVLRREGASPRVSGMFYKAVVQSVLLFGSETWVVSDAMRKALEGFHHRVARQLTGKQPRYLPAEDRWVYPPIAEALEEAGLYTMEEYLSVRRNRLVDYVATRPIFNLCGSAERLSGSSRHQRWWDQVE